MDGRWRKDGKTERRIDEGQVTLYGGYGREEVGQPGCTGPSPHSGLMCRRGFAVIDNALSAPDVCRMPPQTDPASSIKTSSRIYRHTINLLLQPNENMSVYDNVYFCKCAFL